MDTEYGDESRVRQRWMPIKALVVVCRFSRRFGLSNDSCASGLTLAADTCGHQLCLRFVRFWNAKAAASSLVRHFPALRTDGKSLA